MSLTSYVENLRERPEHVRRRHAFWYSFGFSAIVFLFWISSFTSIGIGAKTNTQKAVVATTEKIVTPGASLIAGVGSFANDIWSMIVAPKKVTYSAIEVLPGKR